MASLIGEMSSTEEEVERRGAQGMLENRNGGGAKAHDAAAGLLRRDPQGSHHDWLTRERRSL